MTNAMYQLTKEGSISLPLDGGAVMFLPPEDNGTPEWAAYKAWLSEGNTPSPLPALEAPSLSRTESQVRQAKGLAGTRLSK
jgi:hypothetical protein